MNFFNSIITGFKSIDWLARKVHKLQDKFLIPFIKDYWPEKITPNMVTICRMVLAVIILLLVLWQYIQYRILIISLFIFASLLDLIDGPIARALHKETKLGAFIDPLSDKILVCPLIILFIWPHSPSLVTTAIILEIIMLSIGSIAFFKKIDFGANIWGKWKMCFQVFGLVFILFQQFNIGLNLIWISVGLGISSLLGHLRPAIVYIFKPLNRHKL